MRVGVDTSPLVQTRAGTARHVRGLLGALRDRPDLDLELLTFGGPGRLSSVARDAVWYPVGLGRRARPFDVLHCTTFRGPARGSVPTVLTVHDLAILRAPEAFPRWHRLYGRAGLTRVLRAADAIVAVSEFTKHEVVELADVPPERIRVVPHGVDSVFSADGPAAAGEYVLAVATLEPRKNLARVVDAAREAGVELRVVGARGWGGVEVDGWVGEIPDGELAALYRGAQCVLYPSLYEGFGLPVLEAMACGVPVVTSVGTAMEEVAGDAAVLVDPLDVAAIAAGMEDASSRCDELVSRGLERASSFTWQRAADAVVELWGARVKIVAFDADVLGRRRTGDETHVLNLLRELGPIASGAGLRIVAITRHPELVPDGIEPYELDMAVQEVRMAWSLPRALHALGADLCHTQYAIPLRTPCPCVVTIHDVSFARGDDLMPRKDRAVFRLVVPRAVRQARRVLTVSERTKQDLVELYDVPPDRIVVTPNGVDPAFHPGPCDTVSQGSPYALAVGAIQPRKNQLAALEAANAVGVTLVVAGPEKDPALAAELRRQGARVEGYVDQPRLVELYRGAACLVQASRYEGFGLPVLEAMACGTPVVAVSDPALREVAADAAVIVDEAGLADGIGRALAERDHFVALGLARARAFSWRTSAERTLEVYREILEK